MRQFASVVGSAETWIAVRHARDDFINGMEGDDVICGGEGTTRFSVG